MKKFALLVLLLFLLPITGIGCNSSREKTSGNLLKDAQQRGYLIVGTKYDAPPFGYLDAQSQLKGMEIDLAHDIAKALLGKADAVHFVQVNSSTRVAALNAKQVDFVLATMTINPERAKVVNFSQPYYEAAQAVMVKDKEPIQSIADLKGKKVIFVIGSTGEANLKKAIPTAERLGFKSYTEGFSALNAGRADALSTDDSILYGFQHEYCGLRVLPDRISKEPYGIAFRKDTASLPLQHKVQQALDNLKADGTLEKLKQHWVQSSSPDHCAE